MNISDPRAARFKYIIAVLLFGINPIFIRYTDIPSEGVAFWRAILGLATLFVLCFFLKKRMNIPEVKKRLLTLIIAGVCLGLNWLFLFAAYAQMKVSVASLCNYMAPIIAVVLAPIVLREKLVIKKIPCVVIAFVGIVLVSGALEPGEGAINAEGLFMGAMAALTFTGCIFTNKKLKGLDPFDGVRIQLAVAALVLLPYVLVKDGQIPVPSDPVSVAMILVLGIVSSGLVYLWYYGPMQYLSVQSIAILGYLEPVVCILLSVFLFGEPISALGIVGAVCIIGATVSSELIK